MIIPLTLIYQPERKKYPQDKSMPCED